MSTQTTLAPAPWHWDAARVIARNPTTAEETAHIIARHDPQPEESQALRNSHAELVTALRDAERRFDLLAGWEAGSYLMADYEAMKEVAKDAHREARAALAKVTP